ncbi:MAG: hypothetical protein V2I67_15110 [Thermoanaerobaculales bacterium]|nr:hypothetical protein [Thermoanaerobaculales bacterium]
MKHLLFSLILLIPGCLTTADEGEWTPVETVVAVVDRTPLLASDIDLAQRLRLVQRPVDSDEAAFRSSLLDARIRLEVQFRDLESSGVLYRLDLDVRAAKRDLLESVGGMSAVGSELAESGLDETDVDELALRICAVNAYAEQRLRPRISVSLAEIEMAYRELAATIESAGEEAPPLTAVHEQLHRLVAERKLNDEIEGWAERALAEREVTRFTR